MALVVACPHCGKQAGVSSNSVGQPLRCPHCGQVFSLAPIGDTRGHTLRTDHGPRGPRPSAPELPEHFGRYRILRKLGEGGMGAVYLAHDTQLDRDVALKVPHFTAKDGPDVHERFYREARAAATLDHPNLCPVYDAGTIDGTHYLTMAYVDGKPLAALISADKPLGQRQAAALVWKLALALSEAHRLGIIHRDLKPANVMINRRKEPVVMDFGLARRTQHPDARLTRSGYLLGTPAYMAPEQVAGDVRAMGPGCDIYSLGVILFELLTSRLPFEGPLAVVLGKVLSQEAPSPAVYRPDVDPRLAAICRKAMAKEVQARYPSMEDVAAALTDYLRAGGRSGGGTSSGWDVSPRPVGSLVPSAPRPDRPVPVPTTKRPAPSRAAGRGGPSGGPRSGRRWAWVAAAVGAAAVLLLGVVLLLPGRHGTIRIELEDPTARVEVKVDGESIDITGLGQPLRLRTGAHQLLVTGQGFDTVGESFTVKRGNNPVLRVRLVPNTATVRLRLEPPGVPVQAKVDGRALAQDQLGGPLTLRAGSHSLEVWGEGVETLRQTFTVGPGQNPVLSVKVTPAEGSIKVQLQGRSDGVAVRLDGRPLDRAALSAPLRLRVGTHRLTVTGPGVETADHTFTVKGGENSPLRVPLEPWRLDVIRLLPDDTEGVVAVNVRQLLDSALVQKHILRQLRQALRGTPMARAAFDALGLNLLTDISSVSVALVSISPNDLRLAVLVHGRFDGARLQVVWRGTGTRVHKVPDGAGGQYRVYEAVVPDVGCPLFYGVVNDTTLVIASRQDYVVEACEKATGRRETALKHESLRVLLDAVDARQSLWFAVLGSLRDDKGVRLRSVMGCESLAGGATLSEGLEAALIITASDGDAAQNIHLDITQDLVAATARLALKGEDKKAARLVQALKNVKATLRGTGVALKFRVPGEAIEPFLDERQVDAFFAEVGKEISRRQRSTEAVSAARFNDTLVKAQGKVNGAKAGLNKAFEGVQHSGSLATVRKASAEFLRMVKEVRAEAEQLRVPALKGAQALYDAHIRQLASQEQFVRRDIEEILRVAEDSRLSREAKMRRVKEIEARMRQQEQGDLNTLQGAQRAFAKENGILLR